MGCGKCKESTDCFDKNYSEMKQNYFHFFQKNHFNCILIFNEDDSFVPGGDLYHPKEFCRSGIKTCYLSIDYDKGGCGECPENKYCITCNELGCNDDLNKIRNAIKNSILCYGRKDGKQNKGNICTVNKCFISVDFNKADNDRIQQGCGDCPNNKIPCRTCNTRLCNSEDFFKRFYFCYVDNDNWKECINKVCYYAKGEDNKIYRGCGEGPRENVPFVSCKENFCNKKELFDKTLFCLERNKNALKTKKMINKCNKQCCVEREPEGNLIQGCFDCKTNVPSTQCKTCKTNYCNEEKLVYKSCFDKQGKCFAPFDGKCFAERMETNEVNKGCGDCPSKECKTCTTHLCNDGKDLKYYCLDSNGESLECDKPEYIIKETILSKSKGKCGKCPSNNIPCRTCNKKFCNTEKFFNEIYYCWTKENIVEQCNIKKHNKICYYAVINNKTIEQGCGDKTDWNENNVLAVKCNENICNTKKLFENSLFCLIKGKHENEHSKKILKQCNEECFVLRHLDGKLEQGCGKCKTKESPTKCKTCKKSYCNEEKLVYKHCWKNEKQMCTTQFNNPCFTERTKINKINKGCGKCSSSSCKTCNKNLCNDEKDENFPYFCLNKNDNKECKSPYCYAANLEANDKGKQECGKCPSINELPSKCVDCNSLFCNSEKFYHNSLFCWNKTKEMINSTSQLRVCDSQCFVSRDNDGIVKQGCGICSNDASIECVNCKNTKYCNVEQLVHKQCFTNKGICKTRFNTTCYMMRAEDNTIEKGCGECKTKACKECQDNRCNNWKNIKFYCKSSDGIDGVNQCDTPDCYIMKLNNKDKYHYNCGKCPTKTSDSTKIPKEFDINKVLCAECTNTFCNTEKFFTEQLFCLIKSPNNSTTTKGTRVCKDKCFVYRNIKTGNVTQGCGNCPTKIGKNECTTCKENYCNGEQLVHKHCWINEINICKTRFNAPCYTWRTQTNNVNRGCGNCPFVNCKECKGHRCNDKELSYYCIGFNGNFKECKEKDCYIAKIQVKDGDNKIEQFHYDCGKCPKGVLDILSNKINMSNVQCVDCNDKTTCNSDPFFKRQLFCLEKNANEWNPSKGKRICEKGVCFIGVDKKEIGLVQGCGKCSEYKNLNKCTECASPLCNAETKLPSPRMCYHLNAHFQPFKVKNKTCHHAIDNCYIAIDIFMRAEQNCGDCPSKYKNCKTCKTNFCNNSTLITIQSTIKTTITTNNSTTITTNISTKTKTTTKKSLTTTKHYFTKTSSAIFTKFNTNIIIILIVLIIFGCVL